MNNFKVCSFLGLFALAAVGFIAPAHADEGDNSAYRGHKALTITNPGGWGRPPGYNEGGATPITGLYNAPTPTPVSTAPRTEPTPAPSPSPATGTTPPSSGGGGLVDCSKVEPGTAASVACPP